MNIDDKMGFISIRSSPKIGRGKRFNFRREENWPRFQAEGEEPGRGQEGGKGWLLTKDSREGRGQPWGPQGGEPPRGVVGKGYSGEEGQPRCSRVKTSAKVTCAEQGGQM